jgi:hypothetical protein
MQRKGKRKEERNEDEVESAGRNSMELQIYTGKKEDSLPRTLGVL